MAWFAVDKDGAELVFEAEPVRDRNQWIFRQSYLQTNERWVLLPDGSIEKILGFKMDWNDEPIEVK